MKVIIFLVFTFLFPYIAADCIEIKQSSVSNKTIEKIQKALKSLEDLPIIGNTDNTVIAKEEHFSTAEDLAKKNGYELEDHNITTSDGYILTIRRLKNTGPAVFLMHGLYGSSDDWMLAGKDSLVYYLHQKGYDVWMGNARGNKYSQEHITKSRNCKDFWQFTWDEIGRYDLAASIDYVLNTTSKKKLVLIAHSQGTTSAFVLLSELPEYNDKIAQFIALAPIVFVSYTKSPIFQVLTLNDDLNHEIRRAVGIHEFKPDESLTKLSSVLCSNGTLAQYICNNFLFLFSGFNVANVDINSLPLILNHLPASGSTKNLQHYAQLFDSGLFRKYDYYDLDENLDLYNSLLPPEYDLKNVKTPVSLIYSNDDWISNATDVVLLKDKLTNVKDCKVIDGYSHFDFLFAKDVKSKVYEPAIVFIDKLL